MVTRLKNNFRKIIKYFTIIDIILMITLGLYLYSSINNLRYSLPYQHNGPTSGEDIVESIFNPTKLRDKWFERDVYNTRKSILNNVGGYNYFKSDKLKQDKLEYQKYQSELELYYNSAHKSGEKVPFPEPLKNNFYQFISENYNQHVGFAFINKNTGEVISNEKYIERNIEGIKDVDKIKEIIQRIFKEYRIKTYENDGDSIEQEIFVDSENFIEVYIKSDYEYIASINFISYSVKEIAVISVVFLCFVIKLLANIKKKKLRESIEANKLIFKALYIILGIKKFIFYIKAIAICIKGDKKYKLILGIYMVGNLIVLFYSYYLYYLGFAISSALIYMILIFLGMAVVFVNRVYSLKTIEQLQIISDGNIDYEIKPVYTKDINKVIKKVNKITNAYENAIEEKVQNEKLKTELISNVSHDLRTPLTSIINYVNILENNSLSEEEKNDYINIISRKSNRLKNLINDLFEISKLNSGGIVLEKQPIDLIEFIYQISGEYEDILKQNGLDIKIKSEYDYLLLNLDGKYMSRSLENLMSNVCRYSLIGTRVYIYIEDAGEQVRISFKNVANYEMDFDNEEILENSIKGDKSRRLNPDGSGLGLAIAKTIIELHEGKVNIETEGDMFKLFILLDKGEKND